MKEDSKKKDIWFILIFVFIVSACLLYLFQSSYAKYRRGVSGNVEGDIASWNIKVNGEDIMNKKTLTTTITPTFPEDAYHNEGVIAPGVEGYYTITIDASKVDVPFNVTIRSEVSADSSVSDLKTKTFEYNPTSNNIAPAEERIEYVADTGIVQQIPRNTANSVFRIYVAWDDEAGTMDNTQDTDVGINNNSKALMKVSLHFEQIK